MAKEKIRCAWVPLDKPLYVSYHDTEWGKPLYDDTKLFELLCLECVQAGLSWYTVLQRRNAYRKAFKNFDPEIVARFTDAQLTKLLKNQELIRNRLKMFAIRNNARVFLALQKEFGSFDTYLWSFVHKKPIVNRPKKLSDLLSTSVVADLLSKDLKKRGMTFVGGTICHAFMQSAGLINDHFTACFLSQSR